MGNSFVTGLQCCLNIPLLASSKTWSFSAKLAATLSFFLLHVTASHLQHFTLPLPLPHGVPEVIHITQPLHIFHKGGLYTGGISCSFPSSSICKLTGITTITQLFNAGAEQCWPYYRVWTQSQHFTALLHSATFKPTPASTWTVSLGSCHGKKPPERKTINCHVSPSSTGQITSLQKKLRWLWKSTASCEDFLHLLPRD